MNLFKRTHTAEDVTKEMTAMMLIYLNEMQQCVERKQMSDKLIKERQMLQSLGLNNSKNAQLIADHEKEIKLYNAKFDSFKLMTEAWKLFGNDVMIVRYDQFMQLLEKYNLVCGDLSRYKGYIPPKNLQEIARIKEMEVPDKLAVRMDILTEITLANPIEELVKAVRFPYRPDDVDALGKMGISSNYNYDNVRTSRYNFYHPFISAEFSEEILKREQERLKNRPRFFISAPAQEMEPFVVKMSASSMYGMSKAEQDKAKRLRNLANLKIVTQDPFFCSCTEYGVLIYSKWGDEAQDEIIKRYEQLSKTVNN